MTLAFVQKEKVCVFGVPVDPDSSVKTETPREGLAAYQTKSFQEAANAFSIPNPTAEDVDNHARKYGIDYQHVSSAVNAVWRRISKKYC